MKCPMIIKVALSSKLLRRASNIAMKRFSKTVHKYPRYAYSRFDKAMHFERGAIKKLIDKSRRMRMKRI